jgi:RNA polymerase sigma-70 factor (ECF subfamily)
LPLDDDVVAAAVSGEPDAFRQVYDALAPAVHGYLRARGVEDPEGVTSEVFLAVLPRLVDLRGGAAGLRTLVFSVAHARVVDDVRRRTRRPVDLPYEPEHDARHADSAEHVAVGSLEAERALQLMRHLGEDQRTAVMLRIVGDLSLEETAAVMGRSVASVKQLQRRGLDNLRTLMTTEEVS